MKFAGCPKFAFSELSILKQEANGNWKGGNIDGENVNYLDSQLNNSICLTEENEEGYSLWAVRDQLRNESIRYHIDHENKNVLIEEEGSRPIPLEDFYKSALRVSDDGKTICSFNQTLDKQYLACMNIKGAEYHIIDIGQIAQISRLSENPVDKYNAGMYDIVSSDLKDGLSFFDIMKKINATNAPTHEVLGIDSLYENIPDAKWFEIRKNPNYPVEQVRAIFGSYMEELLHGFPIEQVSCLQVKAGEPLAMYIEEHADFVAEVAPFEGGNMMPGYKTSPVGHYRGYNEEKEEHFDVIVFSDFMGTYAYAWPTPEDLKPQHNAPGM